MKVPGEQAVRVRLDIGPDELLAYYRGEARIVLALAQDGRRIQFPARLLQPFVSAEGVRGLFELRWDADHRATSLQRIQPS